jgi:cytochrome P450
MAQPAPASPSRPVSVADFNPFDPDFKRDPYPMYAALRRESPVHQSLPGLPFYAVTRYRDVLHVLHHPEVFSSTALQALAQGAANVTPNSGALAGHRLLASPMMIAVDPPRHAHLRAIVNRGFTPRRIAALEPRLRELAQELFARVAPAGRMDLVRDFAIPFPVTVISELLGVEASRRDDFKRWSDAIVIGLSGVGEGFTRESIQANADEMADYIERIAAERRAQPRDDLVSVLVSAAGGDALSTGEVLSFVVLLLIAGNETTTNLIGNAMKALLQHPEQLELVASEPALVPGMLEEALRYDAPIQGIPRCTLEEVELGGRTLAKGAFTTVLFGSANRDEEQFPEPDRFDVRRNPQGHLAFGHGIHFCLGAALARLEARVAFETLFSRARAFALAGDGEIPLVDSALLRGPKALPLRFEMA